MKTNIVFIFISIILIASCNQNNGNVNEQVQEQSSTDSIKEFKRYSIYNDENLLKIRLEYRAMAYKALANGDAELYHKASAWHMRNFAEEFVRFSTEMALKHNTKEAYSDIFMYYYMHTEINEKDSLFVNYLLYNLSKAKELGYPINEVTIQNQEITRLNIKASNYYLERMKSK